MLWFLLLFLYNYILVSLFSFLRYYGLMWIKMSMGFPGGSDSKESACNTGDLGSIPWLGGEDPLEKGMATHSSNLAWRIP